MEELQGRVAVVTGAASGIGRAMAEAFAGEGMRLVLADVEAAALEATARQLRDGGAEVHPVVADVSVAEDVEAVGQAAVDVFGGLHVACNNAGVASGGLTWEVDLETWNWVLGVNLFGVVHGIRSFTPRIIASGGGHVVNTASMAGLTSNPGMAPYNASKHAVVTISETMAMELSMVHPEVGVSVLCPGWVRTQINRSERNRPGGAEAGTDGAGASADGEGADGPGGAQLAGLRDLIDRLVAEGLHPPEVAALVVDAIRTRRFYVLTHPEWQGMVRQRVERMLSGQDPAVTLPGN